jgi:hypothetical protein
VRWWSKEASLIAAASEHKKELPEEASARLGVILDAYTVYLDIVLCDTDGNVIANGRPLQYKSVGTNHKESQWFKSGLNTRSKEDFGFETVHRSKLVNDQLAVVFSCAVLKGGDENDPVGVLGVILNWEALAQKIITNTPLAADEKSNSRICIVAKDGSVLADSMGRILQNRMMFSGMETLLSDKKGFVMTDYENSETCIAHALSPGYETYSSGWHSLIIQKLKKKTLTT